MKFKLNTSHLPTDALQINSSFVLISTHVLFINFWLFLALSLSSFFFSPTVSRESNDSTVI